MRQTLRHYSRCAFVLALVMGPLDFGSTRLLPYQILVVLVSTACLAWAVSEGLGASGLAIPRMAVLGASLVGLAALAWEVRLVFPEIPEFTVRHFHQISLRWPNAIVPTDKNWITAWSAAGALTILALCSLCREEGFRHAIGTAMVSTGFVVALLGLLQNATHARAIYWQHAVRTPGAFFGPFYHHTSAGAYLNTVWPLAAALSINQLQRTGRGARRAGVLFALATFVVLGAHLGHISRFPQIAAAIVLAGGLLWIRPWQRRTLPARAGRLAFQTVLVGAAAACIAAVGNRVGDIDARWSSLRASDIAGTGAPMKSAPPELWPKLMRDDLFVPSSHAEFVLGDRGAAYQTAVRAALERPWFGWGPAGWMAAAAANTNDPFIRTFFQMMQFAHEDYLQTLVEWGLVGAAGWALLVLGAATRCALYLGSEPGRDLLGAGAVLGLAAVLIQCLIDFPMQIPAIQLNAMALAALAWSTPAASLNRRLPSNEP